MNNHFPSIARFSEFVQLKDFKPPTKKEYVRQVRRLADHFGADPAALSEEQLRRYFLFLREHKSSPAPPGPSPKPRSKTSSPRLLGEQEGRTTLAGTTAKVKAPPPPRRGRAGRAGPTGGQNVNRRRSGGSEQ